MELKPKHIRVAELYLVNGYNRAQAYKEVYPNASQQTCEVNGCKILRNPAIKEWIKEKQKELSNRCLMSKIEMMEILEGIAKNGKRDSERNRAIEIMLKARGMNEPEEVKTDNITTILWNETILDDTQKDEEVDDE